MASSEQYFSPSEFEYLSQKYMVHDIQTKAI